MVISRSLPSCCPAERAARRRLPARGSRGQRVPTCTGTMRRSDCHPARLAALRLARAPRYLVRFRWFVLSLTGSSSGRSPQITPGLLVTRSPIPGLTQGARWLSQVPEFPLCRHAPLSDPGGVLHTRQSAPRTAAFQCVQTVGFPQRYTFRGSITRPTCSLHPAPYGPLRGGTRVRY